MSAKDLQIDYERAAESPAVLQARRKAQASVLRAAIIHQEVSHEGLQRKQILKTPGS